MEHSDPRTSHVRVLLSLKKPDGTTRFVDQIVAFKPPEEEVVYFSWRAALFEHYDVFHVHWPEWLIRHSNPVVGVVKAFLSILLILRITLTGTPVVRTIHNLQPHTPGGWLESAIVGLFDKRTTDYIVLNPLTPSPKPATLIRPGSYVERFKDMERLDAEIGNIVFFGRIEPYKNVQRLVEVFSKLRDPNLKLRVVGQLEKSAFSDSGVALVDQIEKDRRISSRFEFVSDEDLVAEITRAQLVVLPYTEMHNSGALLVALSLGRVVVASETAVNRWVQEEVGDEWLHLTDELNEKDLLGGLEAGARVQNQSPVLTGRNWTEIARAHYDVYVAAAHNRARTDVPRVA